MKIMLVLCLMALIIAVACGYITLPSDIHRGHVAEFILVSFVSLMAGIGGVALGNDGGIWVSGRVTKSEGALEAGPFAYVLAVVLLFAGYYLLVKPFLFRWGFSISGIFNFLLN